MNPIVTVTGFWDAFVTKIAVLLPNLIFAAAIIVLGWVICNLIKRIVIRLLKLCQLDTLAARAGMTQILERGGGVVRCGSAAEQHPLPESRVIELERHVELPPKSGETPR